MCFILAQEWVGIRGLGVAVGPDNGLHVRIQDTILNIPKRVKLYKQNQMIAYQMLRVGIIEN